MSSMTSTPAWNASERPTLPPLHTLDLPVPFVRRSSSPDSDSSYDLNDAMSSTKNYHHSRRVSMLSSTSSRTPSPTPSDDRLDTTTSRTNKIKLPTLPSHPSLTIQSPSTPARRIRPTVNPGRIRLIPCSMDEAEAVVVVPGPGVQNIPSIAALAAKKPSQAMLLVGPALAHVRGREPLRGARVHPYRFLRPTKPQVKPSAAS
ncbi:hypothetical protein ONZ45_g18047 [Pleurotus djamor]|nr:hypothetical protein ONZ45_g18047 [Pleurotus djamor]